MKIAAIALASALTAIAGSAQPGFAQSTNQNSEQSQYGQDQSRTQFDQTGARMNGSQSNMNDEDDEDSYTTGQSGDNPQGAQNEPNRSGWRNRNAENDASGPRGGSGWGRMEGRMGPHGHRHITRNEGASFSFRNGPARMAVRCPPNEPLQTCVNAATQLLDKIGSLKNAADLRGNSHTNGQGMSGSTGMESEGASDHPANPTGLPGIRSVPSSQPSPGLPDDGNDAEQSDRTDQQ